MKFLVIIFLIKIIYINIGYSQYINQDSVLNSKIIEYKIKSIWKEKEVTIKDLPRRDATKKVKKKKENLNYKNTEKTIYDIKGKAISKTEFTYNTINSTYYFYDDLDRNVLTVRKNYRILDSNFTVDSISYLFNEAGDNYLTIFGKYYSDDSTSYKDSIKEIYDFNGMLIKSLRYHRKYFRTILNIGQKLPDDKITDTTYYFYDDNKNLIRRFEPNADFYETTYKYDSNGRLIERNFDALVSFYYDNEGKLIKELVHCVEGMSYLYKYIYDSKNNLIKKEQYSTNCNSKDFILSDETSYLYNERGLLIKEIDGEDITEYFYEFY